MIDRETIIHLAKENGLRAADLIALAPQNDPFYCGMPSQVKAAEWFAGLWRRFNFPPGVHLRRIHYQMVNLDDPVLRPDGSIYQNSDKCWRYLAAAGKSARYLGYVDPEAFEDMRNPAPAIFAHHEPAAPGISIKDGDNYLPELPELPGLDMPDLYAAGYSNLFPGRHVEIWAEKTTMNDVLIPLCQRHKVNLVTGAGELSITAVVQFLRRVEGAELEARILYISDFDPAGNGMPISVGRKIEFWQQHPSYTAFHDLDIRLQPVVLTLDQVKQYRLPRAPIKESDMRKGRWTEEFGAGAVELDALEANHPGELRRIIDEAIRQHRDYGLSSRSREARDDLQRRLDGISAEILRESGADEVIADYEALQSDIQGLIKGYSGRWDDIADRWSSVNSKLLTDLRSAAGDVDLDDYPLPVQELPAESDTLYDSHRDYIDQLMAYKAHRHNKNGQ